MRKKTLRDIDVANKRVLVRVDYNVPRDKQTGAILDDKRIRATLPTLDYLREQGAKIILVSHLGRPEGRDESLSLKPIAQRLAELIEARVQMADRLRRPGQSSAPRMPSNPAKFSCSKTSAGTRKKKQTTPSSPARWLPWQKST